jgi:hypothetical protein
MIGYKEAASSGRIRKGLITHWQMHYESLRDKLIRGGYTEEHIENDSVLTQNEARQHSVYRRFCLDHYLALSEHALYCQCIGARRDDLTIPLSSRSIGGEFVPRMEHTLNRLKAEFAFARLLYFKSMKLDDKWDTFEDEVTFAELYEGEVIGIESEMLRTSFRLCSGILDKIANGVCDLFNVAKTSEHLYFERFWRNNEDRWFKLSNSENYSLIGLYSQATDLGLRNGEWEIFKSWRNNLEHRMLILTSTTDVDSDMLAVYRSVRPPLRVPFQEFQEKTLHFLQFVRSAIINFALCVRQEALKASSTDGGIEIPFVFVHKHPGSDNLRIMGNEHTS